MKEVWIFNGENSRFASAVFSDIEKAKAWILQNKLSGVLTLYPLDIGSYDWAVEKGYFKPQEPKHESPEFIGKFTSASQEHYHFEDGESD